MNHFGSNSPLNRSLVSIKGQGYDDYITTILEFTQYDGIVGVEVFKIENKASNCLICVLLKNHSFLTLECMKLYQEETRLVVLSLVIFK